MRTPKYLSHSALSQWQKDKEEFYRIHLADTRTPRLPQEQFMSIGSAFDAYAKAALHDALFGKGTNPQFEFTTIFEQQVEAHNRTWAKEHGEYVFKCYQQTGAYDELLALLLKSREPPRFEFTVHGKLDDTVPFVGKPDCRFVHECGVHVILDWKVKGYCSKYGASPSKNYRLCRDAYGAPHKPSRSNNKAHEGYRPYDHHGFEINASYMEAGNDEYADQICTYGWLLGEKIGDEEVVVCIDEIVGKYMGPDTLPLLRVANHRARVSAAHQLAVRDRAVECWKAITTGHIFADRSREDSEERCRQLEQKILTNQSSGSDLDNFFIESSRPQFRR